MNFAVLGDGKYYLCVPLPQIKKCIVVSDRRCTHSFYALTISKIMITLLPLSAPQMLYIMYLVSLFHVRLIRFFFFGLFPFFPDIQYVWEFVAHIITTREKRD